MFRKCLSGKRTQRGSHFGVGFKIAVGGAADDLPVGYLLVIVDRPNRAAGLLGAFDGIERILQYQTLIGGGAEPFGGLVEQFGVAFALRVIGAVDKVKGLPDAVVA